MIEATEAIAKQNTHANANMALTNDTSLTSQNMPTNKAVISGLPNGVESKTYHPAMGKASGSPLLRILVYARPANSQWHLPQF
jgi:hypothetical protein